MAWLDLAWPSLTWLGLTCLGLTLPSADRCALHGFTETYGHPRQLLEATSRFNGTAALGADFDGASSTLHLRKGASASLEAVDGALMDGALFERAGPTRLARAEGAESGALALDSGLSAAAATAAAAAKVWTSERKLGGREQRAWDSGVACPAADGHDFCRQRLGVPSRCAYFDGSPNYDLTSFDDLGVAFLVILQAITFDTWTDAMYRLMAAMDSVVPALYFMLIAVIGGFFVVNLFLAVIFQEFLAAQQVDAVKDDENARHAERMAAKAAAADLESARSPAADGDGMAAVLAPAPPRCCAPGSCAPPAGSLRASLAWLVTSAPFGNASTALVLANMTLMCALHVHVYPT